MKVIITSWILFGVVLLTSCANHRSHPEVVGKSSVLVTTEDYDGPYYYNQAYSYDVTLFKSD